MKKILIIFIVLFLTGCSILPNNKNLKTNQEEVIEEVSNKFDYNIGECLIDTAKVKFSTLSRNDEIIIIDEDNDFYYFDNNGLTLAIEKDYVRTENDIPFEEYIGYTYSYSELFSDFELKNLICNFEKNDEVKVIDKVKNVLLVEYEDQFGYMYPSDVSDSYIVTRVYKPVTPEPSTGGGGGSSYTPPAPVIDPPAESSSDGEDISIAFIYTGEGYDFEDNTSYQGISGKVLIDNINTYITLYARNNEIKVLDYNDNTVKALIHGFVGEIDRKFVKLLDDEQYEEWEGYAYSDAKVYSDFYLENVMTVLDKNDILTVIDEIDDVYVVQLENGTYGYMYYERVSETKLSTYRYVAPTVEPSTGGGGGYTPPSQPVTPAPSENWSAPVL